MTVSEDDRDELPPGLDALLERNRAGELYEPELVPGMVIDDKWKITRHLGSGGFGNVFEVWHLELDQPFAIKFLDERYEQAEARQTFLEEARLMSQLRGRHLVRVLHFAELPNGTLYYVMDLVKGRSLRQRLCTPLSLPESLEIFEGILEGLCEIHAHGYVHSDLKPANIVLSDWGTRIRLLDFGLACTSALVKGHVGGTPPYMAPETVLDGSRPDARADLYAAGVIFYEMITGRLPRGYPTMDLNEIRRSWARTPHVRPVRVHRPDVSEGLDRLLMETLSQAPDERPPTAALMLRRLHASWDWREQEEGERRWPRRHGMLMGALLPVVAVVSVWVIEELVVVTRRVHAIGPPAMMVEDVMAESEPEVTMGSASVQTREEVSETLPPATAVETVIVERVDSSASFRGASPPGKTKPPKRRRRRSTEHAVRNRDDAEPRHIEVVTDDESSRFLFLVPPGAKSVTIIVK